MNRYFCYAALLTGCLLAAAGCAWMNPADSSEDSHLETTFKESAQALPGAWKLRLLGERSSTQEPELAKLTLNFTGEILTVRDATEKELKEGLHGEYVHSTCNCGGHGHGDGECCGHGHGDGHCDGHGHGDGECCHHKE